MKNPQGKEESEQVIKIVNSGKFTAVFVSYHFELVVCYISLVKLGLASCATIKNLLDQTA